MKEDSKKFNIENQIAQGDIINVAGNVIQYVRQSSEEPDVNLEQMGDEFVSQIRIVGHLEGHAMYLDDNLYVKREAESKVLEYTYKYIESQQREGKWVSIIGDAGHGKSCLFWYLYRELKKDNRLKVIPFHAQFLPEDNPWEKIEETVSWLKGKEDQFRGVVILIDTLDNIVGIDNNALAKTLNSLRSSGCLLITASRKQEAERLSNIILSNEEVALKRYTEPEAQEAIRKYINIAYPHWKEKEKELQFTKVWGLLDHQRKVQDLDLEPLILSMIFQAYAPKEEIPQDINTQKVYKEFWKKRVCSDRYRNIDATKRFDRVQLCRFLARQIAFSEKKSRSDTFSLYVLSNLWIQENTGSNLPLKIIESLISSGVLQWAKGNSAIRFFHQTFFEYAAAHDLICLTDKDRETKIKTLLEDVKEFKLFRVPILKQLAIQDFYESKEVWEEIITKLRVVNNDLAARMVLEIIGKIQDTDHSIKICKQWIAKESQKLEGVICKTVSFYPESRIEVALELLKPYLSTAIEKNIYFLCTEYFVSIAPDKVYRFLQTKFQDITKSDDDNKKDLYIVALSALMRSGIVIVLEEFAELFPHVKSGQQAGILSNIANTTTEKNANEVALFLEKIFDTVVQAKEGEVRDAFFKALEMVNERMPVKTREMAKRFIEMCKDKKGDIQSAFRGKILGKFLADEAVLRKALGDITSDDHNTRLMSAEILYEADQRFSNLIMDNILAFDIASYKDMYNIIQSLFRVVSGLKNVASIKVFRFLEQWSWPPSGIGSALRDIFKYLANRDPKATKNWLLEKLDSTDTQYLGKIFTAFDILAQKNVTIFNKSDLTKLYNIAFKSSKEVKRRFAAVAGCVVNVDKDLGNTIFFRIFDREGKVCQTAAVHSLKYCLNGSPEFILNQGAKVVDLAKIKGNIGLLNCFLEVLKCYPGDHALDLLRCLDQWFSHQYLQNIHKEKVLSELFIILKIFVKEDPNLVLGISERCPLISNGVAGAIAALCENITEHSDDLTVLTKSLHIFSKVCPFSQKRIDNALLKALPRLDKKLGRRKVVEWIFMMIKEIKDEQALKSLIQAALKVRSLNNEDITSLLNDPEIPNLVRGILLANITNR